MSAPKCCEFLVTAGPGVIKVTRYQVNPSRYVTFGFADSKGHFKGTSACSVAKCLEVVVRFSFVDIEVASISFGV
jgi:hypothetical protein